MESGQVKSCGGLKNKDKGKAAFEKNVTKLQLIGDPGSTSPAPFLILT